MTKARQQLGTVGSGNHYVDVFADEAGATGLRDYVASLRAALDELAVTAS